MTARLTPLWTREKAVDGTVESTEAAEEPNKLLTVSMPLGLFKQAITQRGLSVEKFVKDFNINLLAVNFSWSDVPLLSVSAKILAGTQKPKLVKGRISNFLPK